jgi:[histone H3]-lysine36 N-dimethyltransferase SETMAR
LPTKLSLEVFATDRKGYALKTLKDIGTGTFVCEYAGELISLEEAARRTKKHPGDTYIFLVQEQSGPDSVPVRTCIDARHKGSLARFINHSCQANLFMIPVRIDINVPRLACFAKQNIPAGEELTVNYAQQSPGETYISSTLCECASSNCRKYLPFQPDLFSLDLN